MPSSLYIRFVMIISVFTYLYAHDTSRANACKCMFKILGTLHIIKHLLVLIECPVSILPMALNAKILSSPPVTGMGVWKTNGSSCNQSISMQYILKHPRNVSPWTINVVYQLKPVKTCNDVLDMAKGLSFALS